MLAVGDAGKCVGRGSECVIQAGAVEMERERWMERGGGYLWCCKGVGV